MSEGAFPPTARRFESVGFSEIVKVRNRVMELLAAGQKVWRFEGGEPWMNTPEPVKAAMGDALSRNQTRYAPSSGIPELRRAILEKVRTRNGIPCDDEAPVVVNGGMQGLFAAFSTLLDPGDEVLLFSPYWTPIVDLIGYHKAQAVLVPTAAARRKGLAAALAEKTTPRTKLIYWNSPNNPTGDVFSRAETEEVAEFARERGLAVISDEAYEDLVYEGEPVVAIGSLPGMSERTITCYTLSKSYSMTGWRLGYVVAPGALPEGHQDGRSLHDQRRVDADAVGRSRGADAGDRVRRGVASRLSLPARPSRRGPEVRGLRDRGAARRPLSLSEDSLVAAVGLPRGRAGPARRGEDRDRAGDRLRLRGRGSPALLVLGLRGHDRRRRGGSCGFRERDVRALTAPCGGSAEGSVRRVLVSTAVVFALMSAPLRADRFDDALKEAQAKLETPEGRAYAASVAASFDEKKLREALLECAETLPPEDNPPFTVLMEMTADGRPTQILLRPPAPVAVCLRWIIRETSFPRPSSAGYWVSV